MGFAYDLSPPIGHRAAFGLIALQSDETLEPEVTPMLSGDGLALYATRVPSAPEVTAETLATMEAGLAASAGLLPPSIDFDVVGYACTSGASVIGAAAVAAQVRRGVKTREVTNPMSALAAACAALGISQTALLSPYVAHVSDALRAALAENGVETPVFGSFDEAEEARVARMDPASVVAPAVELAGQGDVQGVILSCTNLRTITVIEQIETACGLPVLSSNQALAWHMRELAGVRKAGAVPGQLGQL